MALVDVEGVFYATILVGGTRQATAATKWVPIPACSGIDVAMDENPSRPRSSFKLACIAAFVMPFIMDFLIPIPMYKRGAIRG